MDNKFVVIVVERYGDDVLVYDAKDEQDAIALCRRLWEKDMETEKKASILIVDDERSYCRDGYGRLYYVDAKDPEVAIIYSIAEIQTAS